MKRKTIHKRDDTMRSILPKIMVYLLILGVTSAALLVGAAVILPGSWPDKSIFIGAAAIGMVYVLTHKRSDHRRLIRGIFARGHDNSPEKAAKQGCKAARPAVPAAKKPVDPNDINALVEQMLAQDRYALLLRLKLPEIWVWRNSAWH